MERHTTRTLVGVSPEPTLTEDPDDPEYLGPIPIPMDEILLYATPEAELCERVRDILRARGLTWREVDPTRASSTVQTEQLLFTGATELPSLCAGGYVVVGFDAPWIEEILDAHVERLERLRQRAAGVPEAQITPPFRTLEPIW